MPGIDKVDINLRDSLVCGSLNETLFVHWIKENCHVLHGMH